MKLSRGLHWDDLEGLGRNPLRGGCRTPFRTDISIPGSTLVVAVEVLSTGNPPYHGGDAGSLTSLGVLRAKPVSLEVRRWTHDREMCASPGVN